MNYQGQARQDEFAIKLNNYKRNGYYIEIGSNHPKIHNNTYVMDTELNWFGLMVECEKNWLPEYQRDRPKAIHIMDNAINVDYLKYMKEHNFPKNIDYLQIDLNVDNRSSLTTLEKLDQTVMDEYTFTTVTFEHDIYTGNYFDTQKISREIFKRRNYVRLFSDVSVFFEGRMCQFEDWYVHPLGINQMINNGITSDSDNVPGLSYEKYIEIVNRLSTLGTCQDVPLNIICC